MRATLSTVSSRVLRAVAALLFVVGHFLPWALHSTAALTQSAHDLTISTHFTPGAGIFANQWFLVPVWAAALIIAGYASRAEMGREAAESGLIRVVLALPGVLVLVLALGIASLGLPTYPQVLTAYRTPDYQAQFLITLAVMAGVIGVTLLPTWRLGALRRFAPVLLAVLAVLSAVSLVGYVMIKPAIEALYGDSLGVGLGWWVTLTAIMALLVAAARASATIMHSSIHSSMRSSSGEASHAA